MTRGVSNDVRAAKAAKDVKLQVRLSGEQCAQIDAAWASQGFTNRSAFLRHAALIAAGEDSQSPAMLEEMRSHRTELGAVGRNINQLAFEMNRRKKAGLPVDPAMLVKVEDLQAVRAEIKAVADTLHTILRKAAKREGRKRG